MPSRPAKEPLATAPLDDLDERTEGVLFEQMSTLQVLHKLALDLNASRSLEEIARLAAEATYDALGGRGVHVQIWDDEAEQGSVEAGAGPELSARMHREPLLHDGGQLGEIVADAPVEEEHERSVLDMIAVPTAMSVQAELRRRERERTQRALVVAIARLAEYREIDTGSHVERIGLYCRLIAQGLRADGHYRDEIVDGFVEDLECAAPLHDIGKLAVPDAILRKPGPLNAAEWEVMRSHAEIGARVLESAAPEGSVQGFLLTARDVAWAHHEKWDGSGYPRGLAGEAIPLAARILALADIYDALTTERPYKAAWTHERATDWIRGLGGTHLDPLVTASFLARAERADEIRARLADPHVRFEMTEHELGL